MNTKIKFKEMYAKVDGQEYAIKTTEDEVNKIKYLIQRAYNHMKFYQTHPNY